MSESESRWDGPKGETLLSTPFPFVDKDPEPWNVRVPAMFKRIARGGDDRSVVLLTAMVVEQRVSKALAIWMPGFDPKNRSLEFNAKVRRLHDCRVIPQKMITAVDAIKSIRNAFAHSLDVDSLEHLHDLFEARPNKQGGTDHRAELRRVLDSFTISGKGPEDDPDALTMRELFDKVAFWTIGGLELYSESLRVLRGEMPEWVQGIRNQIEMAFVAGAAIETAKQQRQRELEASKQGQEE